MHKKEGKVLRYVCALENGKACAKVVAVAKNSPLGSICETDNIIAFSTEYYNKTPVVVQVSVLELKLLQWQFFQISLKFSSTFRYEIHTN